MTPPRFPPVSRDPPAPPHPRAPPPPFHRSFDPGVLDGSASASAAAAAGAPSPASADGLMSFSDFKNKDPGGWVALLYAFLKKHPTDTTNAKKFLRSYISERALFKITSDVKKDRTIPAVMKAVLTFLSTEAAKTKSNFPTAKQVLANLTGDGEGEEEEEEDDGEVRYYLSFFQLMYLFAGVVA
jgi:hypothetical protein